jgi:hypothetical protein
VNWQNVQDCGALPIAPNDDRIAGERCHIGRYAEPINQVFDAGFCFCISHNQPLVFDVDM